MNTSENLMHVDQYFSSLKHMLDIFDKNARQLGYNAKSIHEAAEWKENLRAKLREITGISKMQLCNPEPQLTELKEFADFRRERWLIQTEPDVWMPFYILIPTCLNSNKPFKCIIAPHGHDSAGKYAVAGRTDIPCVETVIQKFNYGYGVDFVKRGYIVFCPDARAFGERRESAKQSDNISDFMGSSCVQLNQMAIPLGLSVCGMWIWDLMRLIDYIETRPDCDKNHIACAGLSGGGYQSLYLAAMDDRVRCCVTSGYFFGAKESLLVNSYHCGCNYVPHLWETCDIGDIGALIAPRPLLIETGLQDSQNGQRGIVNVSDQVDITRSAYITYGVSSNLVWSTFDGPHMWNGSDTYDFIQKYN